MVDGCVRLVMGDYRDHGLLQALAPEGAAKFLDGRGHDDTYWFRVWAMRGLLWSWDDSALDAVLAGTRDEAWRVRELAAKVVARNGVGDALPDLVRLRTDPVLRVRTAAARAVAALTTSGA